MIANNNSLKLIDWMILLDLTINVRHGQTQIIFMELTILMIEFLLLAVLFVIAYFYYTYVRKPQQLYDYYAVTFEKLGYRVLKLPFKPFSVPFKLRY